MSAPTALLAIFFLLMVVMLVIALEHGVVSGQPGFTLSNFTDVLTDPLYREVAVTTVIIATAAMLIQLVIAIPLAYVLAFKAGRWSRRCCCSWCSPTSSTRWCGSTRGGCCSGARG